MSLNINDPIYVSRDNRQLEGIVAYMGPVEFSQDSNWVGVRLTGASVGLGKNNGSVQNKSYFECAPQCGLFVKQNLVTPRKLTRLEELRLKRELAQGASSGGDTTAKTTSTPRKPVPTTPSATKTLGSTATKTPGSSTTATRLEEIRQRRAQLSGRTTPASSTGSLKGLNDAEKEATTDAGATATTQEAEELKTKLQQAEADLKVAREKLSQLQKETNAKDREILSLERKAAEAAAGANTDINASSSDKQQLQDLQGQLDQVTAEFDNYRQGSQEQLESSKAKIQTIEVQLAQAQAESQEWQGRAAEETSNATTTMDATHFKERAKLQAQVASTNRRVEQLLADKQDLEHTVEDLTLDKEQLLQEQEELQDQYEELKLDYETSQMETEELKMELEQAKVTASEMLKGGAGSSKGAFSPDESSKAHNETSGQDEDTTSQAQDMASNLSIQNARLREALIRLREQSSVQQMEMSRQLRNAEKQAAEAQSHLEELQYLRQLKQTLEEQISDLKDMVEQGSAYEVMVEDLSDRVLGLEEELINSRQLIRELEEAADITAEMEEVQTDELKALNRDLEDRETILRNLEEAIKMQRKREEDFQRTVSNYRATVETLKQEKKALLELQEGGEGEKSDLVSASQKALARAAQLVQDAAEMRKREAQAAIDRIDSQVRYHLSERLESMIPPSVASREIAAIKGELLLSKVVGKASLSLDGIGRSFSKMIRARAWEWRSDNDDDMQQEGSILSEPITLSDEQRQSASTMIHQSEVAHVAIDVSGNLLWLLSAGQWPDIVGPDASAELGTVFGHSMNDLDMVLGNVLNTLKEEGVLSAHQSNIGAFKQTVTTTMQSLRSHIEHDGESLVPMSWKPPALRLFRDSSRSKYAILGCYAAVASLLNYSELSGTRTPEGAETSKALVKALKGLLQKLDKTSSEASKSCLRLATLDVQDESVVTNISGVADRWRAASDGLITSIFTLVSSDDGVTADRLDICHTATDEVLRLVSQFAAVLRTANLNVTDDQKFHPFSPEVADVWEGVTMLARSIREKDGDDEDVNFLVRARSIEQSLEQAVEKEPKLALANAKVSSLEKSLALRSKEIAVQNTRLSELEKLLARTSAQPAPRIKSSELVSSEEINNLKQENRVLSEAMDVLHRQVEEYEGEIRFLKDAKSPTKGRAPRRSFAVDGMRGAEGPSMGTEAHAGAFEAALFRPALLAARRDAAHWRSKATLSTLLELPPLHVPRGRPSEEEKTCDDGDMGPSMELNSALANYRIHTASFKVVDLTKPSSKSPRSELYSMLMKKAAASQQLDEAATLARQWLEQHGATCNDFTNRNGPLYGRVKFTGAEPIKTVFTSTTLEDLHRLQLHLVR